MAEAVRDHGPVPAANVRVLAAGLASGLRAIHEAGLVHRDLNPSNVLLAADGPRVTGFGLGLSGTDFGSPGFGSPGFMSPEQALGHDVGPPSDIFSLGAVLAYAATGQGPFGVGSAALLMYRLVNSPADLSEVPGSLRYLVGSCLAKEPGERPSASGVLRELGASGSGAVPGAAGAASVSSVGSVGSVASAAGGGGGRGAVAVGGPGGGPGRAGGRLHRGGLGAARSYPAVARRARPIRYRGG